MSNALRLTKKSFTWSVVLMTILWSMGVAALVPMAVSAVDCPSLEAGDLFKVEGQSAVYLLNADMERMYFPHSTVFHSWYDDFSGVVEIPSACFDNYPNPDVAPFGVNYRPGSYLVKVVGSPSVYAILPGNTLAKIASPEVAEALYGPNWGSMIVDVSDFFWPNFTDTATDLTEEALHDGMLVMKDGGTTTYYVMDGMLYEVEGDLGDLADDVRTVADSLIDALSMAGTTMTASEIVADPPQLGESLGTPAETADGTLTVALSPSTPASETLSASTAYNDMLKVNLTAGSDEDVTVNGLTVTKTGLTANTSVGGVSVWHNGMRLGDVVTSISSDDTVVVGFGGTPLVVAAGDTESLVISFNFSSTATGGTVGAKIAGNSDIDTTAAVAGSFPVMGNTFSLTDGTSSLADLTVDAQGVGGLTNTTDPGNVEIGDTKDVGKFQLTQSNGKHDVQLEQIVFYVPGTVKEADLENFKLRAPDNSVLATTASMSDRYVTMSLATPYTIPAGLTRLLTLSVDIADGSGNYFSVELQNDYDVLVKDAVLGYYIVPMDNDGGAWTSEVESGQYFRMKSGSITITKAPDSPSGNISAGATEVVLAKYKARAVGEDFEVRKIGLKLATGTNGAYLNGNVRVMVDGKVVHTISAGSSAYTLYNSDSTQYTVSTRFTLKSGTDSIIEIVGNVPTTATASWAYTAYMGNFYGKRMSTIDFQDDFPTTAATIQANALTVQTTALTVEKDTSLGNRTVAPGSNHVVGQYVVKAGDAEDVCVTNMSVNFTGTAAMNIPTTLQNVELWLGDAQLGSTLSSVASSSNSFSGNLCLTANEQKTLTITSDVLTGSTGSVSSTIDSTTFLGASTSKSGSVSTKVGQDVTFGNANVIVTAVNDSTTISALRLPGDAQQVGKWKFESQNEATTLQKIKFSVRDNSFADDITAGNFGTLSLYDSADMTNELGTASYVPGTSNGYVHFTGLDFEIPADGTKYLVLKSNVNGSGAMNPSSINVFVITDDTSTNLEILSANGSILGTSAIDATAGVNQADSRFATSTFYLFHNSAPTLSKVSVGSDLDLGQTAKVFKFTLENEGDRELRVASSSILVSGSGMAGAGAINTFKFWEANESGEPGTLLAQDTTTAINTSTTSATLTFHDANDLNSLFDNLTVPAGGSRTFILTADTSNMFTDKSQGTVSFSASIDGDTGYAAGNTTNEADWNVGGLLYHYTPIGSVENTTPYSGSDSYDVIGDTLSRSL